MIEVGLVCSLVTCDGSDEISFLTSPYSTCMLHHDALQRVYELGNRSILVLEQDVHGDILSDLSNSASCG